jgi:hypothetical protein
MWFEVAIISMLFAIGHILLARFEENTPRWKLLLKFAAAICAGVTVSAFLGAVAFWSLLALMIVPVLYVHIYWLPSKGINGWTAEPKSTYYALRGWPQPPNLENSSKMRESEWRND